MRGNNFYAAGNKPWFGPRGEIDLNLDSPQNKELLYAGIATKAVWNNLLNNEFGVPKSGDTPVFSQENFGGTVTLGTGDQIDFRGSEVFADPALPFTLAVQLRLDTLSGSGNVALKLASGLLNGPWQLYYAAGGYSDIGFSVADRDIGRRIALAGTGIAVVGDEHWLVIRCDGSGLDSVTALRFTINGQHVSSSDEAELGPETDENSLGRDTVGWDGPIRQLRVYDYEWPDALCEAFYTDPWDLYLQTQYQPFPIAGVEAGGGILPQMMRNNLGAQLFNGTIQ